jgi:hypothetical protein
MIIQIPGAPPVFNLGAGAKNTEINAIDFEVNTDSSSII